MRYNGKNIEVAWVDLDDTLIDFKANSRSALVNTFVAQRLDRVFADVDTWIERYEYFNHGFWEQYSRAEIERDYLRMERFRRPLTEAGMADDEARKLSTVLDPLYLDLLAEEHRLVDGAVELLVRIRELGARVGVLSNGFKEVQHRKISSAGLAPYIDMVVLSDDIGVNKPDVRLYRHAMQISGCMDAESHLMVGDNPATDIAGAINAGWSAILLGEDTFRGNGYAVASRLSDVGAMFE